MTFNELLSILVPIAGGGLGVGSISAYYSYKSSKPKTLAEAQKINAEVVLTFADGWKTYAAKLDERLNENDQEIRELKKAIRDQDEKNRQTLREKDEQISELQAKNRSLERRVNDLEMELLKYQQVEQGKSVDVKDRDA